MIYYLVGLGNPGEEYENTRHNAGRIFVSAFCKKKKFGNFEFDKKNNSLRCEGKIEKNKVVCLLPQTFMNKSGSALKKVIKSKKAAARLIAAHDDIDLPLGKFKISFGKGSGGHKGVESVMRAVKTKDFYRVRIGTSPVTPKGKIRKPKGEKKVLDFLMGEFKPSEISAFKKVMKAAGEELEKIITK